MRSLIWAFVLRLCPEGQFSYIAAQKHYLEEHCYPSHIYSRKNLCSLSTEKYNTAMVPLSHEINREIIRF